jgi:hypothetical protein
MTGSRIGQERETRFARTGSLLATALLLAAASCVPAGDRLPEDAANGTPTPVLPWRARPADNASQLARTADAVESHVHRLRARSLPPEARGDATRTLTGYFDGGDLVLVVESIEQGDYGASDRRWFFEGAWLYHHRAAGMRLSTDNSGLVPMERRLYLAPDGTPLYSFQALAGNPEPVTAGELTEVLGEARHLRRQLLAVD